MLVRFSMCIHLQCYMRLQCATHQIRLISADHIEALTSASLPVCLCAAGAGVVALGVPLPVAGVFVPEGPKVDGDPISPFEPPSANDVMYALLVS